MNINNMNELYTELLSGVSRGYKGRSITNPAIEFTKKAKAGTYNTLTDEEYYEMMDKINEVNRVWFRTPSRTVGDLLLTALENIELQDEDLKTIVEALMCSYEKTDQEHVPCDPGVVQRSGGTAVKFGGNDAEKDVVEFKLKGAGKILGSPASIYKYLDKNVYGQDEAKKAAAMLLWNHVNGRSQNVVFAGPTGCGKTEIFRQLSKLYPNIVIHNATALTGTGWKGNMKVRNLFDGATEDDREHLIIVLDEADKLFEDADDRHYSFIIQNELLKLMEGDMVHFEGNPINNEPTVDIDTSNVSFVFLGSFDSMVRAKDAAVNKNRAIGFGSNTSSETFNGYMSTFTQDDLVEYANVRNEVAGRIGNIVQLRDMSENDFYNILCGKEISPIHKLEKSYGVKIKMSSAAKSRLAREAVANKMGVRYMRSQLQRSLDEQMFSDCGKSEYKLG